jgi:hypothetical protein
MAPLGFPMKSMRTMMIMLGLVLALVPLRASEDRVADLKAEINAWLPPGSHEDRVRQFLKVRKTKVKSADKNRTLTAHLAPEKRSPHQSELIAVFRFDADGKLLSVSYDDPKQPSAGTGSAGM